MGFLFLPFGCRPEGQSRWEWTATPHRRADAHRLPAPGPEDRVEIAALLWLDVAMLSRTRADDTQASQPQPAARVPHLINGHYIAGNTIG